MNKVYVQPCLIHEVLIQSSVDCLILVTVWICAQIVNNGIIIHVLESSLELRSLVTGVVVTAFLFIKRKKTLCHIDKG